jgi:hypothetical protein
MNFSYFVIQSWQFFGINTDASMKLSSIFKVTVVPNSDFVKILENSLGFDSDSLRGVVDVFKKLGLPLPAKHEEFMRGTEGALLFLDRYGVVIRIEPKNLRICKAERMDYNPWIIQPIGSIPLGDFLFEIYPGCAQETDRVMSEHLVDLLKSQKIHFWDTGCRNVGRMPFKTVQFPEGIPVVIDTGAVKRLTKEIEPVAQAMRKALESQTFDAAEAQEKLYGPLREMFAAAWQGGNTDAVKMQAFWGLCRSAVEEGKLVAGWMQDDRIWGKRKYAELTGAAYEKKLSGPTWKQALREKLKRSNASAVPQSPRSPA